MVCWCCRIDQLLEQVDQGSQVVAIEPIQIAEDIAVPRRDSDLTAWVNVIHGCNEKCTYCVVPNTRGVEQSRAPDAIRVNALYAVNRQLSIVLEASPLKQDGVAYGFSAPFPKQGCLMCEIQNLLKGKCPQAAENTGHFA